MTDDPESNLEQWKETMQAEHDEAIHNPDPDEDHRIEGVAQVSYRVSFEYDPDTGSLERADREQVDELADPELLSCACGVRGMTPEEATAHVAAVRE
ncbi:hypothetical protein [Haloarcula laminariae]|uniref:hypothetical protein n=1 Tax=Haloarcula laminariae TaxID=2961577 RepID=UPI002406A874|nr:hypothetical protein [Halomicroarcula sp. FL173]